MPADHETRDREGVVDLNNEARLRLAQKLEAAREHRAQIAVQLSYAIETLELDRQDLPLVVLCSLLIVLVTQDDSMTVQAAKEQITQSLDALAALRE